MTGPLLLDGDPIYQEQATPKSYVDNAVSNIAFKVESFYRTSALLFDGNTVLVANTISCVDTSYYTFSAWYYQFDGIANGSTRSIFSSSNDAGGVGLGDPYAGWFVYAGGANGVVFTENNGEFQGNVASWHHVLVATDLTVPTFQIYVDGTRINADITQEGDPTTSPHPLPTATSLPRQTWITSLINGPLPTYNLRHDLAWMQKLRLGTPATTQPLLLP